MASKGKVIAIGALAIGLGLMMGSGGAKASPRAPWTTRIDLPGVELPWSEVDRVLCLCADTEADDADVPLCALLRIYPDVPWPSIAADHETVREAERRIRERWATEGDRLCAIDGPAPVPDMPAPPIGRTTGEGGGFFWRVEQGDNPTSMVRAAWGLPSGHRAIAPLIRMVNRSLANLSRYARREQSPTYYTAQLAGEAWHMAPAFLPRNAPASELLANRWQQRTVTLAGAATGAGSSFGTVWLPSAVLIGAEPMLAGEVSPDDLEPSDPRLLPPLEWLAIATYSKDPIGVLAAQWSGDTGWRYPVDQPASAAMPVSPMLGRW